MATEVGEFSLIVTAVESARIPEVAKDFGKAFNLDDTIATQICKSAPIIFAQKLTKSEVKAITPMLGELSRGGMEFRVTARVATRLPKVNWPVRPQFTVGGIPGVSGLAFEWDNNAFVCPSCGENFLFRRLGKLNLVDAPATDGNGMETTRSATPSSSARIAVAKTVRATVAASAGVDAGMDFADEAPPAQMEGVEGMQPLAGEGESFDLPETVEETGLSDDPVADKPISLDDLPSEEGGEVRVGAEEIQSFEPEVGEEVSAADADELYNVFLSKITDTSKRDKAAELIAGVKGCSTSEAKELTTRLVIPLAKNVDRIKAEEVLNQFKKLKIFGRMTKVR